MNPEEIKKKLKQRRDDVYREMRRNYRTIFKEVVSQANIVAINNKMDLSVAAEVEYAMMSLALDIIRRK
jgi:hypothetical protein